MGRGKQPGGRNFSGLSQQPQRQSQRKLRQQNQKKYKHLVKSPRRYKPPHTQTMRPRLAKLPAPPAFKAPPQPSIPTTESFDEKMPISTRKLTTNYNPVKLRGFADNRPEILCVTDFLPAYKRQASTRDWSRTRKILPVGEKLMVMFELARLRDLNLKKLISALREDEDAAKIVNKIEADYDTKIGDAITDIRALSSLFVSLEKAKDALNLRKSQNKIMAKIATMTGDSSEVNTYQDILEELGFSRDNINQFSNTKILMQIIYDLSSILGNYSPSLLGIINPDRVDDDEQFELSKTIFDPKQEPMIMDNLRRAGGDAQLSGVQYHRIVLRFFQDIASENVFDSSSNKIKFLMNLISKEMIISTGLGNKRASRILSTFNSEAQGNIFDNICGIPGDTVLDTPLGGNRSLLSFVNVATADGNIVLPFESPLTTDADDDFVSGAEYFIDAILQGQTEFNPAQLAMFIKELSFSQKNAESLMADDLLSLRGYTKAPRPSPANLFDAIAEDFKVFLTSNQSKSTWKCNKEETQLALMTLGETNIELKMLLYQYTLLAGIYANTSGLRTKHTSVAYTNITAINVRYLRDLPALNSKYKGSGINNSYSLADHVNPGGITDIIDAIVESVIALLGNRKSTKNSSTKNAFLRTSFGGTDTITEAELRSALEDIGNPELPFQSINSFLNEQVAAATIGFSGQSTANYYIDSGRRTRFSLIPPAVLVAIVYEAYSSFATLAGISLQSMETNTTRSNRSTPDSNYGEGIRYITQTVINTNRSFLVKYDGTLGSALNAGLSVTGGDNASDMAATIENNLKGLARQSGKSWNTEQHNAPNNLTKGANSGAIAINRRIHEIQAMRSALEAEENLIISMINFIFAYFRFVIDESKPLLEVISIKRDGKKPTYKNGKIVRNMDRIREFQQRVDSKDIFATLNPAQIALSIREGLEIQKTLRGKRRNVSAFSDQNLISSASKNMLMAMLREPRFKRGDAASNLKLVTVGIPSGMKASLKSFEILGENTPGPEKEVDLININVFRRDVEFDDIVFKPMSFLFELSRFTDVKRNKLRRRTQLYGTSNSYSAAGDVRTIDIQVDEDFKWGGGNNLGISGDAYDTIHTIGEGPEYDMLTTTEKHQMFNNHITSYFLGVYLRLLTDMDFRESSFLINSVMAEMKADDKDRSQFMKLLLTRVKNVAGRSLTVDQLKQSNEELARAFNRMENKELASQVEEELTTSLGSLTRNANLEITDDVLTFLKSFSPDSLLTGADVTAKRLITPKLFERIFHLPVDLDEFEIDIEATRATQSGSRMLDSAVFKVHLKEMSNGALMMKSRPTSNGYHILSEIFINIDTKFESDNGGELVRTTPPGGAG